MTEGKQVFMTVSHAWFRRAAAVAAAAGALFARSRLGPFPAGRRCHRSEIQFHFRRAREHIFALFRDLEAGESFPVDAFQRAGAFQTVDEGGNGVCFPAFELAEVAGAAEPCGVDF